jgi:hypothetical protein
LTEEEINEEIERLKNDPTDLPFFGGFREGLTVEERLKLRREEMINTKEKKVVFDSDRLQEEINILSNLMIKAHINNHDLIVPIYDEKGNMLWPLQMTIGEIRDKFGIKKDTSAYVNNIGEWLTNSDYKAKIDPIE